MGQYTILEYLTCHVKRESGLEILTLQQSYQIMKSHCKIHMLFINSWTKDQALLEGIANKMKI